MKILKAAFYHGSKTGFSKLIQFQQSKIDKLPEKYSKYSHVELILEYEESFFNYLIKEKYLGDNLSNFEIFTLNQKAREHGIAFSSSEYDKGVRFKIIEWKKNHWDFFDIKIPNKKYDKVKRFCVSEAGKKYNWWGIIFAQGLRTKWFIEELPHGYSKDWYCSQISTRAIQEAQLLSGVSSLFTNPGKMIMELEHYLK